MYDTVNPRQVICVTSRAKLERFGKEEVKDNIITVAWHSPVSSKPQLYGICIGNNEFSKELILKSKVFVVNFMSIGLKKEVLFCGKTSGRHADKFKETGLTKEESEMIDCPRIKEAIGFLEIEVTNEIPLGDSIFIVGKVVNHKHIKDQRVFYMGNGEFSTTIKP